MLPFCGYHMGDYFAHWLNMGRQIPDPPRIFSVNWFRKDENGKFMWPGFGENMRVLKWIIDRCRGQAYAVETVLGWMPRPKDIDLEGLKINLKDLEDLQHVDLEAVKVELLSQEELFLKLAGDLPKEMVFQRELLVSRLCFPRRRRTPARGGASPPVPRRRRRGGGGRGGGCGGCACCAGHPHPPRPCR
jgi:phosphoenolpyruvate carboxykinase (GTP)